MRHIIIGHPIYRHPLHQHYSHYADTHYTDTHYMSIGLGHCLFVYVVCVCVSVPSPWFQLWANLHFISPVLVSATIFILTFYRTTYSYRESYRTQWAM